jgi:hypothetical protein
MSAFSDRHRCPMIDWVSRTMQKGASLEAMKAKTEEAIKQCYE